MKAFQIILIVLTSLSGCIKKADTTAVTANNHKTDNSTTMTSPDSLTYLALGDSYTIGQSVNREQSFPHQLTDALNYSFISAKSPFYVQYPTIIATTGWTTDDLINGIANGGITNKKFSFVTLLIGVNDQYEQLSLSNYKVKFVQVLKIAINFANGDTSRVFVLSIPDYGVTPFGSGRTSVIGPEIDQFNAVNRDESKKAGVNYLNITTISREAATNRGLVASDGLHPSAQMYKLWVQQLEPVVEVHLKK
ncbi:MAG: GDSL-like Lipase/Acylhydrolase [Mucilaginibacter sp.]|nr:GDSL-like Lipase/Acylhydrolase [Mucilaginibacter sp.]